MKKNHFIVVLILYSTTIFGQLTDLCGIWIAKSYQCYSVGPGGLTTFYFKDEVVLIEHIGQQTIATKLTGDGCVMAGQTTWQGNYNSNPFSVVVTIGSPGSPGSMQSSGYINVKDSIHLEASFGSIKFIKATCEQIDSLKLNLDSLNKSCIKCAKSETITTEDIIVNIPNVFTPNNDGVNDYFLPIIKGYINKTELYIYNRWGLLIYKTTEVKKGWNGKSDHEKCPDGVYFWIYKYTNDVNVEKEIKGNLTLFN